MSKGTDKVKAGMDKKRLDYYKKKLLARRDELLKTIARTAEDYVRAGHLQPGGVYAKTVR